MFPWLVVFLCMRLCGRGWGNGTWVFLRAWNADFLRAWNADLHGFNGFSRILSGAFFYPRNPCKSAFRYL